MDSSCAFHCNAYPPTQRGQFVKNPHQKMPFAYPVRMLQIHTFEALIIAIALAGIHVAGIAQLMTVVHTLNQPGRALNGHT